MNVLYIEDNALDAELVQHTLWQGSPEILLDTVASHAEAIERLNRYEAAHCGPSAVPWPEGWEKPPRYDLMLTDLKLPGSGGGFDLLAQVRRRNLPLAVVILTGSGNEQSVLGALRAGADDYLAKRTDYLGRLATTLHSALAKFQEQTFQRSRPLRVLYAEPNEHDAQFTLREAARQTPHLEIEIVPNAAAVLHYLEAHGPDLQPDVLLLDHRLPDSIATDLVKELCQVRKLHLPIILITGQGDEEIAMLSLKLGAADYVVKNPGYLQRLPAMIENAWLREQTRRQALDLRDEKARLAGIIESAMDAIITIDEDQRVILVNRAAERIFGCPSGEALGQSLERFIPPRFRELLQRQVEVLAQNHATRRTSRQVASLCGLRANGEEFPMEVSISQSTADGSKLFTFILRDITRRAKAELELRASADFVKDILHSLTSQVVVLNHEGTIIAINEAWQHFASENQADPRLAAGLGVNYLEVCARSIRSDRPGDASNAYDGIRAVLDGRESFFKLEYPCHSPLEQRWFVIRVSPLTGSLQGVVINHTNITERRKLEEQLRQSQKMEAIGQLSSGVAHDFNNILTVVQMHSAMLEMDENLAPNHRESAGEILKAAERAANLTRQLLAFGRRQTMQPRDLDLNEIVAQMTRMLQRIVGEDIQVQLHYASHSMLIHADPGMIEQILLNLVVNSRDAMQRGGRLVIKTAAVQFDAASALKTNQARPGSFVCLSVRDTGAGIPLAVLPRIFDPFFTTKEVGKGTGLGLATVYGIVLQHNGWINVESIVGHGTTFRVYLPQTRRVPLPVEVAPGLPAMRGGGETILVAEDEPNLRLVVRIILGELGYRILEATTGREALRLWKEHQNEIQLLFTDLIMPDGMSGRELAEQIHKVAPSLKVIYTSGYSTEVAGKDLALHEGINFLGKPFTPEKLVNIIRAKLDEA